MSVLLCDIQPMQGPFDIDVLRRKLSAIMDRENVRPTTLSLRIGTSSTLVKDLLEKTADTKLSTLYKLADALNVSVVDLLDGDVESAPAGPSLFVKGEVAAGQWVEAFEWPMDDWQVMTGRADVSANIDHRFFLRVCGDSMNEVYPEGTFIECVSVFGQAEVKPGRRVVVLRRRRDQLVEATVKELVEIDGELWFVPRSSNPAHHAFKALDHDDDIEEVTVIAVVVSSVRPE